jgi:hypothetical protein
MAIVRLASSSDIGSALVSIQPQADLCGYLELYGEEKKPSSWERSIATTEVTAREGSSVYCVDCRGCLRNCISSPTIGP